MRGGGSGALGAGSFALGEVGEPWDLDLSLWARFCELWELNLMISARFERVWEIQILTNFADAKRR